MVRVSSLPELREHQFEGFALVADERYHAMYLGCKDRRHQFKALDMDCLHSKLLTASYRDITFKRGKIILTRWQEPEEAKW